MADLIVAIKAASDCRSIFRRFWPSHYRDKGNCQCPFHDDRNESLQVTKDRAYCHAEAKSWDAIDLVGVANNLDVVGAVKFLRSHLGIGLEDKKDTGLNSRKRPATLQPQDEKRENLDSSQLQGSMQPDATVQPPHCTLQEYAQAKQLPLEFLKTLGLSDRKYCDNPAIRIPYYGPDGQTLGTRFRISMEGNDKFRWCKGDKANLYGLWRICDEKTVTLVEGESDCHTLWYHGVSAVGLPGAGTWKEDRDAGHLQNADRINVVIEPDTGGETVKKWVSRSSIRGRVHLISLNGFKDPSGMHSDDPGKFLERWKEALDAAVPWTDVEEESRKRVAEGAWLMCKAIATQQDILGDFYKELRRCGVVGEERTVKLLYLSIVSRFLDRPISICIKGPSSGGKSHVSEQVLKFFPESSYYALTAMSEHALAYLDEPLRNRFLVLYEVAGMTGDFITYLVRSLLSEGCISYQTVEKTSEGMKPRMIRIEGPTGLLLTTTSVKLHPENETRMLSLPVTDTKSQTAEVLRALANEGTGDRDLSEWQALQVWLDEAEHRVVVPYGGILASNIPPVAVRLRRDFKAVLNLIKSHAILHQANRGRNEDGVIVATVEDYGAVFDLVADFVSEGLEATVPATIRETVAAVKDSGKDGVTVAEVAKRLNLDKSAAWRRASSAIKKGYLTNLEDRKGRPAKLAPGEPLPDDVKILPDPETVARLHGVENGVATASNVEDEGILNCCDNGCKVAHDSEGVKKEVSCASCRHFTFGEPPNMSGRCSGCPYDANPEQFPHLPHDCKGFQSATEVQHGK